jgi:hypothetical protein
MATRTKPKRPTLDVDDLRRMVRNIASACERRLGTDLAPFADADRWALAARDAFRNDEPAELPAYVVWRSLERTGRDRQARELYGLDPRDVVTVNPDGTYEPK